MVWIGRLDQFQTMDLDGAWRHFHHLAVACEIISALAVDLDRREARRHLGDLPGEARQELTYGLCGRAFGASIDDTALGVIGVALLAPARRETIHFAAFHDERNRLGRLPECDWQHARGERVECAGMAGALCLE